MAGIPRLSKIARGKVEVEFRCLEIASVGQKEGSYHDEKLSYGDKQLTASKDPPSWIVAMLYAEGRHATSNSSKLFGTSYNIDVAQEKRFHGGPTFTSSPSLYQRLAIVAILTQPLIINLVEFSSNFLKVLWVFTEFNINKWLALKNFNTLLDKSNKDFMVFPKSSFRVNPVRVVPIITRLTAPSPNQLYPLTFYLTGKKRKEGGRTMSKIQFT
uniref:Uncharacterized protein n=1 Tax=Vespula pensylvanica TaxID=30213 RepID=A0A834P627_VESPE|nr:hypothetical protein H0235_006024 [Vespula pensylvanica]